MLASLKAEVQALDVSRHSARVFPVSRALKHTPIHPSGLLALVTIPGLVSQARQTTRTGVSLTIAIKLLSPSSGDRTLLSQEA